ncbi:response regulator [candidate division KSB1 bacterium]|nr:response regulator [candidate division KSB1 bacterium]
MNINNEEFIDKLQDAVSKTFETMLFAEVTEKEMCGSLPEWTKESVASTIEIIEPHELKLRLYFEKDHASELVDMLYGEYDKNNLDTIIEDFVSECSNAIAGQFATKLLNGDNVVKLGVPVPLKNGDQSNAPELSNDSLIILFGIDDRKIVFTIESKSPVPGEALIPGGLFSDSADGGEEPLDNTNNILIVDDSNASAQFLEAVLSDLSYNVTYAVKKNGSTEFVEQNNPDLVLLAVDKKDNGGIEFCKSLKSNSKLSQIPVIFVSPEFDRDFKQIGFKSGSVDFLSSDLYPDEIVFRIDTHLSIINAKKDFLIKKNIMEQLLREQTGNLMKYERQALFGKNVQGIVHNMNNQISGILGYAQLMRLDLDGLLLKEKNNPKTLLGNSKPALQKLSKRLNSNLDCIERFIDMINSLMNKSRFIQSEEFEVIELNELLRDEIGFLDVNKWYNKNVNLIFDFSDKELLTNVVPSYISQVLQNLVKNGIDAVYGLPNPTIKIKTGVDDDKVWFSVSDNGRGIPEKILPRIFEAYFTTKIRDNDTEYASSSGTGLGLYMCSELISLQQGNLFVEKSDETGASFKVEFKKADEFLD